MSHWTSVDTGGEVLTPIIFGLIVLFIDWWQFNSAFLYFFITMVPLLFNLGIDFICLLLPKCS